ncbi:MAG: hypothetical protein Q7U57_01465 [Methylovulum sp.]|nr:hypothetical protein [Methylovulum sp.]
MKTLLVSSLIFFLTACAGPVKQMYTLPEGLGEIVTTTPLACRFDKQMADGISPQNSSWYFWREAQRTETRDERSNQGEVWERNHAGQLFYTRLFYNERVALEFVPGDLAATGATTSWAQLSSIIDPNILGKELPLLSKETSGKTVVEYYSGTVKGVATEVDWLPALQLPARIVKQLPEGAVTLVLAECGKGSKFAMTPITKTELDKFRHLDYTDLGDMEEDPMVQHLEQLMGGGHHHDGH